MKSVFLLVLIALHMAPVQEAAATDFSVEQEFIGKYKLIQAVKETEATVSRRPSRCRDNLTIKQAETGDMLTLFGINNNGIGQTLNWIDHSDKEGITTEVGENSLTQKRLWGVYQVLGVKQSEELVTSLEKENETLIYRYRTEVTNSLTKGIKIHEEAVCLYREVH